MPDYAGIETIAGYLCSKSILLLFMFIAIFYQLRKNYAFM